MRLRCPGVPVQPHDWMTPLLRYDADDLGDTRARRFQLALNHFLCPSQNGVRSLLYPAGLAGVPDRMDFEELADDWTAVSYLMPVHFQYVGQRQAGRPLAPFEGSGPEMVRTRAAPQRWEVRVDDFLPRLNRVGQTARKIAFADGTRYLDPSGILDHDVSPWPDFFGSFTSAGAWWSGSTAYGVRVESANWAGDPVTRGSPSDGANLGLTYRHGCGSTVGLKGTAQANRGTINAMFFDGHLARLDDRRSRAIDLWYPRGGEVEVFEEGMTREVVGTTVP
jgi:hypothetical protein